MKCIYAHGPLRGQIVETGAMLKTFRGEAGLFDGFEPPGQTGEPALVYVLQDNGRHSFYPMVFDLAVVEDSFTLE